ncbi:TonB-dependent receptor [Pseudoxanthomonas sp.]|uniref:TonB-dependent siderophore receptor n=1 Tax=Pseudoxanthomonas sp. TaxID=1871049 RepID=UPI00260E8D85|nr:TonB-dependent receptor [Pseudoxanthomonas sp.]WDS37972.1 MAG: TonB-dependent receptor [Pseudoxanthomonas sp.]
MRLHHPHSLPRLSFLAAALLACHVAWADEDPVQPRAKELDTVQVKAQQVTQSSSALGDRAVIDTPFAITTVDSEQLQTRQVNALGKVFAADASVTPGGNTYGMWSSLLYVRGLALDYSNSYKINGMPFYSFGVELPTEMFEQVQLLKGATGFMYGFGAPGGIVNYVTKKPTDTPLLSVDVGYRSDALFSEHVDVGGRAGSEGRFGYRINVSNEYGNTYNGSRLSRQALGAAFELRLSDTLSWTTDLLYQRRKVDNPMPYVAMNNYTSSRFLGSIDGSRNLASDAAFGDTRSSYGATTLHWQFAPDWTAELSYSALRTDQRFDQEYLYLTNAAGDYVNNTFVGHNTPTFSVAQAQVQGRFNTGPLDHQVVAGATEQVQQMYVSRNGQYGPSGTGNLYDFVALDWHPNESDTTYHSASYRQHALFVSDTVALGKHWSLLAGMRHTDYRQLGYTTTGARTSVYEKSPNTPTVALLYQPDAHTTYYASYVESLEAGSTVGSSYANAGEILPPMVSKQTELGFKAEHGIWSANAALFRILRGATYVNASNYYVQDGQIRYQGLELQGRVRTAQDWSLGASLLLLDADYQRSSTALTDKRPGGVARRIGSVQLEHTFSSLPALNMHLDARYTGPMYLVPGKPIRTPGYTLLNLGAGYRTQWREHPLTLRAEVQNLLDKDYWQGGSYLIQPGAPRTLALNAKLDF